MLKQRKREEKLHFKCDRLLCIRANTNYRFEQIVVFLLREENTRDEQRYNQTNATVLKIITLSG